MPDMEKVISGLEHCIPDPNKSLDERMEENECRHAECPYGGKEYERGMGCFWDLMSDALVLLKEQEDLGTELTNAVELIHKKNERIEKLLKEQEAVVAHWDDNTGHWIEGDRNGIDPHARTTGEMIDTFRCSWCGFYQYWKTPFCPNCGAKMEGR